MNRVQLLKLQADPAAFRRAVIIDSDVGPIALAEVIDPWQERDFKALDGGWLAAIGRHSQSKPINRAWLERPRGHSKTSDLGIQVVWALFASCTRLSGVCVAADADQAALLRNAIAKIVQYNEWLQPIIDVQKTRILNSHTGSELQVISSDVASSWGLTPSFVICDEICHWASRGMWDSLLSASAKRSNCLLLCILNAGQVGHWSFDTREAIRTDSRWHFSRLDGPQASWINPDSLEEQRRLLPPKVFSRLWLNEWQDGSGDAIDNVDQCVTLPGPQATPHRGTIYVSGLDIGISRDATAFVTIGIDAGWTESETSKPNSFNQLMRACMDMDVFPEPKAETKHIHHPGTGRLRLVDVKIWKPQGGKVELELVESAIIETNNRYRLASIAVDPWQAEMLRQRLQRRGLPVRDVSFTGPNLQAMASAVMDAFRERTIDLYDHKELLADLKNLRIVERSYGYRLESPKGNAQEGTRHGDAATALGLAMFTAKQFTNHRTSNLNRELVCYPSGR